MSGPVLAPDDVAAELQLSLVADSGYITSSKYRISANQWGAILKIAEGRVSPRTVDSESDLLQTLERIANASLGWDADDFRRAARAALSKATGEQQ